MDNIVNLNYETLIEKKLNIIETYPKLMDEVLGIMLGDFVVNFIENALESEGKYASEEAIRLVLNIRSIETDLESDTIKEILNIKKSYDYIFNKRDALNPHLDQELKLLNSRLLFEINNHGGLFNVDTENIEVQKKYDRVMRMENKIIDIVREYRQFKTNIIESLAKFYLEFIDLSPFIEKNELTGELFINMELIKNGYPPVVFKTSEKDELKSAIESYDETKNISRMKDYLSKRINESLDIYIETLKICNASNRI